MDTPGLTLSSDELLAAVWEEPLVGQLLSELEEAQRSRFHADLDILPSPGGGPGSFTARCV